METQIITIPVTTDMDATQLLDIVNTQISQIISDEIESYGYEVEVDENEISVESIDDQIAVNRSPLRPLSFCLVGRAKLQTGWLSNSATQVFLLYTINTPQSRS